MILLCASSLGGDNAQEAEAVQADPRTVKCGLKSIVRDEALVQESDEVVLQCNAIVTEGYQLIRLYCLTQYAKGFELPRLDETFFRYALKTLLTGDNRGRKAKNQSLKAELEAFYVEHLKPLLAHEQKYNLRNYSQVLHYLAKEMHTSVQTNIVEHYEKRLLRFIKLSTKEYGEDVKALTQLRQCIFNNDDANVPPRYAAWFREHRRYITPSEWTKCLAYDIKANPLKYVQPTFYMAQWLENAGLRTYEPLSQRTSIVPKNVLFDTKALMELFALKEKKSEYLKHVSGT